MKICNPCLLLVFLTAGSLGAQNFPFPTADAEWVTTHVSNYCIGGSNIYFLWREYLGADTVIQGKTYQRLLFQPECEHITTGLHCTGFDRYYNGGPITVGGIRSDSQKVFFYKFDLADSHFDVYETALKKIPAGQDILLYDFNWAVGDTVVVQMQGGNHLYMRVLEIHVFNGRKEIVVSPLSGVAYQLNIVEGTGAGAGLFGLYYSSAASFYLPLGTCFYHNGGVVLSGQWCGVCGLVNAPGQSGKLPPVRVYPNPASEAVYVEADPGGGPYQLRVHDLQGRLLYADGAFPGNTSLAVSRLPTNGWVLLSLQTAGGSASWTGRVWVGR